MRSTLGAGEAAQEVASGEPRRRVDGRLVVLLVVGPAVDVKLIAMQAGVFGRRFAARFAPLTFAVAVVCALVVGRVVLR